MMFIYAITISIIFSYNEISGITFDGPCPNMPEEIVTGSKVACEDIISGRVNYAVFGNLPVDNLISIFGHNWDIHCIFFEFACFDSKESLVSMKEKCSGFSTLDDNFYVSSAFGHYTKARCSGFRSAMSCLSVVYETQISSKPDQLQNYGMVNPQMCTGQLANFTIYTLLRDNYLVLYGCMDKPETDQHEEGAWILFREGTIASYPDTFYDTLLDKVLEELPGVSATTTNFQTVNFRERKFNIIMR